MGVIGKDCPVVPVTFSQDICETAENVRKNIESALARNYVPFNDYLAKSRGVVSICGSAPSLKETWPSIKGDVLACNAAHDFLVGKGVIPTYALLWDASEVCSQFITPRQDVLYLLASRCHPKVLDQFNDFNWIMWHAGGDKDIEDCLEARNLREPIINGGSAAVSRCLFLCYAMGYSEIHLYGADSSCQEDETHVRPSIVEEKTMEIYCADKWFKTTPWLAVQAEDFKLLAPALRDAGVKIVVHGDGLIPHIAGVLGFEVTHLHEDTHASQ